MIISAVAYTESQSKGCPHAHHIIIDAYSEVHGSKRAMPKHLLRRRSSQLLPTRKVYLKVAHMYIISSSMPTVRSMAARRPQLKQQSREPSTTVQTPEFAGKGIEYSWACAKGWYRWQPLKKKRKKDDFHTLVKVCVMPSTFLVNFDIRWRKLLCRSNDNRSRFARRISPFKPASNLDTPGLDARWRDCKIFDIRWRKLLCRSIRISTFC